MLIPKSASQLDLTAETAARIADVNTEEARAVAAEDNLDIAISLHTANASNPHAVTKAQVGLGNVDNTSDAGKPVSTAQQTALDLKAPLASPTFTGTLNAAAITASGKITCASSARCGEATLVAGTVTVTSTGVTANTKIFLSRRLTGGTAGTLTYTKSNGASFTINSTSILDTSTIAFFLIETA